MGKFIDMTGWVMSEHGVPDSRWTIIEYKGKSKWLCECNCKNKTKKIVDGYSIKFGASKSCGCYNSESARSRRFIDMSGWIMKQHGVSRSRLTVIEHVGYTNDRDALWKCVCECGNNVIVAGDLARNGKTLSCGCLHSEVASKNGKNNKKENDYDITTYNYGIGWAYNSRIQFEFDLDDYNIIKNYCWSTFKDHNGYTRLETAIEINGKYKRTSMAQLLTGKNDIDHKDKNPMNNRRSNFREATRSQQTFNQKLKNNNTSGITGVYWDKTYGYWVASIQKDKKRVFQESYNDFNDAVVARLNAELLYFGEFAPQKHLFEQYGILTKGKDAYELQ